MGGIADKAIQAFSNLVAIQGKIVDFLFYSDTIDPYNPKQSNRTLSRTASVKVLYHFYDKTKKEETILSAPGLIETGKLCITVLKETVDLNSLYNAQYVRVGGKPYKISSYREAVGFKTPADRVYFFCELTKEID